MSLTPGTTLGPYQITAKIGEGGMGAVYRAHDARLNRDVAIKVSGERFTERFEREAKAIAALNHTNVCHLYDVGPDYLVMELVEGESLRGPLPLDQARPILQQLIDGIEAAHEKGITHRDLKPANIRVTPEGVVKILDFGLAKLEENVGRGFSPAGLESPASVPLSQSPTMASPTMLTGAGMILGTAAYMAPEQARGKAADQRADIWAFGAVAYELLTGAPAFPGESVADILGAVLHKEPDWSKVPSATRPLLQWCLEKDRRKRLQAIGDARRWLEQSSVAQAEAAPSKRPVTWMAATVVALVGVAALAGLRIFEPPVPVAERMQFELSFPEGMSPGPRSVPALSPDGRQLAFVAVAANGVSRLWVRSFDASAAMALEGTDGAFGTPFWSPDGRSIVYQDLTLASSPTLRSIEAAGGPSRLLCELPPGQRYLFGGFWTADGTIVAGLWNTSLMKVSSSGGTCVPLTVLREGDTSHAFPFLLPDGQRFLYGRGSRADGVGGIYVGSLDLTPEGQGDVQLLKDATQAAFMRAGDGSAFLVFVREGTLFAQRFDSTTTSLNGDPIPIAERIGLATPAASFRFSTGGNNTIVYQPAFPQVQQFTWLDRSGKTQSTAGEPGIVGDSITLSPDDGRVAFNRRNEQGEDIGLLDFRRGVSTRFTTNGTSNWNPAWAPDSSRIAFSSGQKGPTRFFIRDVTGPTGGTDLDLGLGNVDDWSPDGRSLVFALTGDLWLRLTEDTDVSRTPSQLTRTSFNESSPMFSPDGRWLAYVSDESGRNEVYVQAIESSASGSTLGASRTQVSNGLSRAPTVALKPRWRADGRELFYVSADRQMMSVDITTTPTLSVGAPRVLFAMPASDTWDVARDGQRFLFALPVGGSTTTPPYRVILNWQAALEPTN